MASPDSYVAQYDQEIVAALNIAKPEKLNKLFLPYADQGMSFFMMLNSLGFEQSVTNRTFSHFEEGWYHESIKVKANVADPGAGNAITFALHADSVDNGKYYVRVGDQLMFDNGVTAIVTSIVFSSPDYNVTAKPVVAANNIGALTANDLVSIVSNGFAEGTDQPKGRFTKSFEVSNHCQIIKTSNEVTGSEMTNAAWFKVTEDGAKASAYYHRGLAAMEYRHQLAISGALLVGEKGSTTDADGNTVYTTGGLNEYMADNAQSLTKAAGTWAVSDFDAADRLLTKQYAPKYMCIEAGIERHIAIENAMVTYLANTEIDYTRKVMNEELFGGNESLAASVNFKLISKSERTYALRRMSELSNPKLYNRTGLNHTDLAFFIPLKKFKDEKTNKYSSYIGYRWKEMDGYSRKAEIWETGGAGPIRKTDGFDLRRTNMRSEIGGHWMKGNQMLRVSV